MFVSSFYFFILILFIFIFFYFYVFIYLFSILTNRAGPPIFPKDFCNRNGTSPGPPQRLPWPPCPVCHHRQIDTGNGQWLEESSKHCPHRQLLSSLNSRFCHRICDKVVQNKQPCHRQTPPLLLLCIRYILVPAWYLPNTDFFTCNKLSFAIVQIFFPTMKEQNPVQLPLLLLLWN